MSSYEMSPEMIELLENPILFDEEMLKRESMKAVTQGLVTLGAVGVGIYYMYRGKVKELENDPDVEMVEVYVDEQNNIIPREDIENSIYEIDLESIPSTTIIEQGELHVVDPEMYKMRQSKTAQGEVVEKSSNTVQDIVKSVKDIAERYSIR